MMSPAQRQYQSLLQWARDIENEAVRIKLLLPQVYAYRPHQDMTQAAGKTDALRGGYTWMLEQSSQNMRKIRAMVEEVLMSHGHPSDDVNAWNETPDAAYIRQEWKRQQAEQRERYDRSSRGLRGDQVVHTADEATKRWT